MPSTTFLLNGFSIVGDPQSTNTNASDGGNLMLHSGTAVFEDDDILLFTVENVTVDGVFTADSYISGFVVYDNASDYYNDLVKYTYSGTADIDSGRRNMGDRYIQTDASGLTSSDAGAPVLGEVAIVAGVKILETLATNNGPLVIPTNEDIDVDGDGNISADEQSDGSFSSFIADGTFVICFAAGTLIETPSGPQYIETLREGDEVMTLDFGAQEIRWIGSVRVAGDDINTPIRIKRGALGNIRDLWVSPNHRMLVKGPSAELLFGEQEVLVAAKHLVNGCTIIADPRPVITYYHFACETHQIVFAEGCAAETLYTGNVARKSIDDFGRDEILAHLPPLTGIDEDGTLARYTLKQYEARVLLETVA